MAKPTAPSVSLDPAQRMLADLFGLLEVSVSGTLLTLRCAERAAHKEEQGEYYRRELPRGGFSRSLVLPAEVDEAKASATLRDGLLELKLPKPEKLRRHRVRID